MWDMNDVKKIKYKKNYILSFLMMVQQAKLISLCI